MTEQPVGSGMDFEAKQLVGVRFAGQTGLVAPVAFSSDGGALSPGPETRRRAYGILRRVRRLVGHSKAFCNTLPC